MGKIKTYIVGIVSALYTAASAGLLIASRQMPDGFAILGMGPYIGEGNISDYLAVLSIHATTVFLVTGLMSMLGVKEEMVFHVDIVQRTLLEPFGWNFRALSVYAFTTLAVAVAALAFRSSYVVVLSALVGTVVVTWMFFKMIGIYFGKDRWRKKILKEIMKKDWDYYREAMQRLYGVLRRDLAERDTETLARNLALLVELKTHYRKESEKAGRSDREQNEAERRREAAACLIDDAMDGDGALALELYVRMLGIFTEEGKPGCAHALNGFFMDYVASHGGILEDRNREAVMRAVFDFDGDNPGIQEWIGELSGQAGMLAEEDFRVPALSASQESRFVRLARETCQARLLATFHDMRVCYDSFGRSLLYKEIEGLVACDEGRVRGGGFRYPERIHCDSNDGEDVYSWEHTVETGMREGLFVQWFPRYAALYGGDRACRLLEEFFDGYREHAKDGSEGTAYAFEYYSVSPKDPEVFERMRICYLQGCAELVMEGVPGMAGTVAGMVAHFWEEAQSYRRPEELQELYRRSFRHIGEGLLYADDSRAGRGYNERPEGMLRFLELLAGNVRDSDTLRMDMGDTFGGFLDMLRGLCPGYYGEETVRKAEGVIRPE